MTKTKARAFLPMLGLGWLVLLAGWHAPVLAQSKAVKTGKAKAPAAGRRAQPAKAAKAGKAVKPTKSAVKRKRTHKPWFKGYRRVRYRRYDLHLATIYDGNFLFTYFGHNAFRVRDRRFGGDINYNFGTFGFEPNFKAIMTALHEYLQFKLKYWVSTTSFRRTVKWYRYFDRTYNIRRLNLTNKEANKIAKFLRWHIKEENKYYPYHHYTNNCSTKVRDILLLALGSDFKKRALVKRGRTYRSMVMDKVRPNPLLAILMDFGMGPPADRELTWWQEMFLPERLEEYVTQPWWEKERGRPLVGQARFLVKRKQQRALWQTIYPVTWVILFTVLWMLAGLALFRSRFFRFWLRSLLVMLGLLGLALFGMLVFTKFPEPPGNVNILFYHPLHFWVWWWMARKRWSLSPLRRMRIRWYFAAHVIGAVVYLLLKAINVVPYQINAHYMVFIILTMGLICFQLWRNPDWGVEAKKEEEKEAEAIESTATKAAA